MCLTLSDTAPSFDPAGWFWIVAAAVPMAVISGFVYFILGYLLSSHVFSAET